MTCCAAAAVSIWGGDEADLFDFDLVSDSPANARDWVMDFSQTEGDKLDVSGIDAKTPQRRFHVYGSRFHGRLGTTSV